MREAAAKFVHEKVADILAVAIPNGTVMAAITLLDLQHLVTIGLGILTAAYTVWRWRRDAKKS